MRAIIATLLSGLLVLSAQPPQAQQAAQTLPSTKPVIKFGTTTQLVVVDVSVKDKSGNPIKGLKPADFNIMEDGKKQDIKVFTYQELEEAATTPEPVPGQSYRCRFRVQDARSPRDSGRARGEIGHRKPDWRPPVHGEVKQKDQPPPRHVLRHDQHAHSGPDPRADRRPEIPQRRR